MTEPAEQVAYAQSISVPYRYTAGEAQRRFLRGLEDGRIVGARHGDRVLVPARPFGPDGTRTEGFVEVAEEGVLVNFTTVEGDQGRRTFGLIQLDGADSAMLHLVEADESHLDVGMRVRARWSEQRVPEITAIAAFVPV